MAFASTSAYHSRPCYAGVAECRFCVARNRRGFGAGRVAMMALLDATQAAGFWELLSRILPEKHSQPRTDGEGRFP
jgi:L-amino acid N-acyltransferase YncA